jgi:hypothetical protein
MKGDMVVEYHVMTFQECPKCKEFEPSRTFNSCSFTVVKNTDKTVQVFECPRCKYKWEKIYK